MPRGFNLTSRLSPGLLDLHFARVKNTLRSFHKPFSPATGSHLAAGFFYLCAISAPGSNERNII